MNVDIVLNIAITACLASILLITNLRTWRGHRVYLLSSVLGLNILSLSAVFDDTETIGLRVLLGPSLANISLLRLLLLLDIVSSSKLYPLFNSPWSLIQLSFGPLWGLARLFLSTLNQPSTHLDLTLDGIEAFGDFGCCLLYLSLKMTIVMNTETKRGHNNEKIDLKTALEEHRPRWRLVENDGYILSITASLACRGSLLVLPCVYLPWVLPLIIFFDLRTAFLKEFRDIVNTKDAASIYVTREASKTTSSIFTNVTVPDDVESLQSHPAVNIPRSITFTGRCALSSILSAVPQTSMNRSRTWSGPLDETLRKLVGDKQAFDAVNY